MIERLEPVTVVQVRIASKHLSVQTLHICFETLRESAQLSKPFLSGVLIDREADELGVLVSVRREYHRVVDFVENPFLDELNVLRSRDSHWVAVVIEPCIGKSIAHRSTMVYAYSFAGTTNSAADMVGQLFGLQSAIFVLESGSITTLIMPSRRRYCSTTSQVSIVKVKL